MQLIFNRTSYILAVNIVIFIQLDLVIFYIINKKLDISRDLNKLNRVKINPKNRSSIRILISKVYSLNSSTNTNIKNIQPIKLDRYKKKAVIKNKTVSIID